MKPTDKTLGGINHESLDHFEEIRREADCLCDEETIAATIEVLAGKLRADYAGLNPVIICVMNGGLWTTAKLIDKLDIPLELDYLHASRYRGETSGGKLMWEAQPKTVLNGRHVLIVDDILDEGITLQQVQIAIESQGVASLKTLALVEKLHDRRVEGANADYVGLAVDDRYVFGCGMDYHGQWRQLPAIYAVKGL